MEILVKVGNKRNPDDPEFRYDWRDGQIINIRPDGYYEAKNAKNTKKTSCIIHTGIDLWAITGGSSYADLKPSGVGSTKYLQYIKPFLEMERHLNKYPWEPGFQPYSSNSVWNRLQREFFVDFDWLLSNGYITLAQYESIYDHEREHAPIYLDIDWANYVKPEASRPDVQPIHNQSYAQGDVLIGTSQDEADWSDAISKVAASLTGDLNLIGNTSETIAEGAVMTLNTNTGSSTLTIKTADAHKHQGVWNASKHNIDYVNWDKILMTGASMGNIVVQDMQFGESITSVGVEVDSAGNGYHCIFQRNIFNSLDKGIDCYDSGSNPDNLIIRNNLIVDCDNYGISIYNIYDPLTIEVYNNTVVDCTGAAGIRITGYASSTITMKNNLVYCPSATADYDVTNVDTSAYNISSDTSGDSGYQNWSDTSNFTDYSADPPDCRLSASDTLLDDGEDLSDLSGDPAEFSDDIAGQTRSDWYIGASEYLAAGGRTASFGAILSPVTASQAEKVRVSSSSIANLTALLASLEAQTIFGLTVTVEGVLAAITSSSDVNVLVSNDVVAALTALTSSLNANVLVAGDIVGNLTALTGSLNAKVLLGASVVGTLEAITANQGDAVLVSSDLQAILEALTSINTSEVLIQKEIAAVLSQLTSSAEARIFVAAAIAANLEAIVAQVNASTSETPPRVVNIAGTLASIISEFSAKVAVSAQLSAELASITGLLSAAAKVGMSIGATLDTVSASMLVGYWCGNTDHSPHPLPDAVSHGRDVGGQTDNAHEDKIQYTFPATSSPVILTYDIYDIDYVGEVEISCNGVVVKNTHTVIDATWQNNLTAFIPDTLVSSTEENHVSFWNTYNRDDPAKHYVWGARNVDYTEIPARIVDIVAALQSLTATITGQILVQGSVQATLEALIAYVRIRTLAAVGSTGFPFIDGATPTILGG